MGRSWAVPLIVLVILAGCSGMRATRNILPVADQDVAILPRARGIAATKDDISVVVAPLQDVKELDGFGILIINESPNWISFKKEDFVLIQSGEARYPMSDAQVSSRLGSGYRPTMPGDLNIDIFEWRRDVNLIDSREHRIMDQDKKLSIMSGTKDKIFVYFKTRDDSAPIQLIIPNIHNEAKNQRTRFSFKFSIEKS